MAPRRGRSFSALLRLMATRIVSLLNGLLPVMASCRGNKDCPKMSNICCDIHSNPRLDWIGYSRFGKWNASQLIV
ncbi:hypothetical protein F5Y18DRAFT_405767 [Xylariaceae sp. FL1019]|nr:hypothetical protein F5Y18DRAFT_405767 [Xylariaceae sp. FL1019]